MLQRYFGSMAGRLFLLLLLGVMGSASIALGMADVRRQADLRRIRLERISDRVQDFISLVNSAPAPLRMELISRGITGLRPASGAEKIEKADTELTQRLNSRIGPGIRADHVIPWTCFPQGADRRIHPLQRRQRRHVSGGECGSSIGRGGQEGLRTGLGQRGLARQQACAALDRGALVAFPKSTRRRYVRHLMARLIADAALLLVTIEYDSLRRTGPPFPVFPQEVADLFPGAVERARHQLRRPRWDAVGGAEVVLWTARIVNASPTTT